MKIQSISDLITNSSTEVFVVYDESNIKSIKELVNAILSLSGTDKTFDDYFEISLDIDYDSVVNALDYLERYIDDEVICEKIPEIKGYIELSCYNDQLKYAASLPKERLIKIIDFHNEEWCTSNYQLYSGISIVAKSDNAEEAARIIDRIDSIFDLDYISNY